MLSELKEAVGLHNGVAAYHLGQLEQGELVGSAPAPLDGRARCFFPAPWREAVPLRLTASQQRFFDFLRANPGATAGDAAGALDLTRQSVEYTAHRLEKAGFLRRETGLDGTVHWYVSETRGP